MNEGEACRSREVCVVVCCLLFVGVGVGVGVVVVLIVVVDTAVAFAYVAAVAVDVDDVEHVSAICCVEVTRCMRWLCVTAWEYVETTGLFLPGAFVVYPGGAHDNSLYVL